MSTFANRFHHFYLGKLRHVLNRIYFLLPGQSLLFTALRPFWTPPLSIRRWLRFKGVFSFLVDGKSCRMENHGDYIECSLFWKGLEGDWERVSLETWIALCRKSNTILDIGANTGVYSLVAKTVQPDAHVYGFEPVKRICDRYKENCRLNNFDVHCSEVALSNYDGEATIYDPGGNVTSVTVNENHNPEGIYVKEVKVKTETLKSFIAQAELKQIDLIKMDVEGHEPEVLEGFGSYLRTMKPTLLIEITTDLNAIKVENLLSGLDYLYFDIDEKGPLRRVEHLQKSSKWNFLICQPEVARRLNLTDTFSGFGVHQ